MKNDPEGRNNQCRILTANNAIGVSEEEKHSMVGTQRARGKMVQNKWKELGMGWQGYVGFCRPGSNAEFITSAIKSHWEILSKLYT